MVRALGRSGIAAAADASTFNGDPSQPFWRVPGQNIGNGLNLGLKNAADTLQVWGSQLVGDQKDFNEAFNQFATKLKNGDFPLNDATKLRAWMAENAQTLSAQQARWYDAAQGTEWNHGYAVTNGLQSPRNAAAGEGGKSVTKASEPAAPAGGMVPGPTLRSLRSLRLNSLPASLSKSP